MFSPGATILWRNVCEKSRLAELRHSMFVSDAHHQVRRHVVNCAWHPTNGAQVQCENNGYPQLTLRTLDLRLISWGEIGVEDE